MSRVGHYASWVVLFLRCALAIHLVAAGIAALGGTDAGVAMAAASPAEKLPWLPPLGPLRPVGGVLLVVGGGMLALGWFTRAVALSSAFALLATLVYWLSRDALYNTTNHLVPFVALALGTFALERNADKLALDGALRAARPRPPAERTWSWLLLVARLFLGSIFVAQGLANALTPGGPVAFAREVYVTPLAQSAVPQPLLWIAGVLNPPTQLIGATLIVLGLWTRPTAAVLGLFLMSILFGHTLDDPFVPGADIHSYALSNLAWVLLILGCAHRGNAFSVDALRAQRAPDPDSAAVVARSSARK